jgi:hypothetical protein
LHDVAPPPAPPAICGVCEPEKVRVLWWDTAVHGEQVFEGDYANIAGLLKPLGGKKVVFENDE